jgi:predicted permease
MHFGRPQEDRMFDRIAYALKHGLRGLLRERAFTFVALLSLALGVGANSAIFSLVDQALLRQLPVRQPQELVLVRWEGPFVGRGWGSDDLFPHPLFRELAAENTVFDGLFARHPTEVSLAVNGSPEQVGAEVVSGSYFGVLGVAPALGRLLDVTDDLHRNAHPVVVLSFDYWKNRLGAPRDIVGRTVRLNSHPMTVIGVTAEGFHGVDWGEVPSVWVPLMMKRQATPEFDWLDDRRGRFLHVFARLKPGVSREQAQAALQPWFKARLEFDTRHESWPAVTDETKQRFLAGRLELLPAAAGRSDLRAQLQRPLLVLLAATGLVLLLACLNVANLWVARAFVRRQEIALRLAMGATRGRIVSESLTESGLLALAGGGLGLLLAPVVIGALVRFLPGNVSLDQSVDARVLWISLAVAVVTGLVFGLAPALHASRTEPGATLKEGSSRVAGGLGLRKLLVAAQVALALILLVGAGLFVRTLANLRAQGPGFATTNLVTFRLDPGRGGYDDARSRRLFRDLLADLRARPEVEKVGLSTVPLLMGGSWNSPVTIEAGGRIVSDRSVHHNAITPGWFETLGARIVAGRAFDDRDLLAEEHGPAAPSNLAQAPFRSVIVNQSFVQRYLGGRNPIGVRIGFGDGPQVRPTIEIVGVVGTFSYRGLRENDDQTFFPFFEDTVNAGTFYVRTRVRSDAAFAALRAAVRQRDPELPLIDLRTIEDQLDRSLVNERLLATLAAAFAGLAMALAVVGLYGVTAFVVSRRTREIGIRLALGSTRRGAVWVAVRDTVTMLAAGLAVALPAVWALGRLVQTQLFGLSALDPATIAAAVVLIALTALAASAVPARRAASVSPTEALRYE